MNIQNRIRKLERFVRYRTFSINNTYDKKLIKAYYTLASLYYRNGDEKKSHACFRNAEHMFLNMRRRIRQKPIYITRRNLERYELKLLNIADRINYKPINSSGLGELTNKYYKKHFSL